MDDSYAAVSGHSLCSLPEELPRRCILPATRPGDLVVDLLAALEQRVRSPWSWSDAAFSWTETTRATVATNNWLGCEFRSLSIVTPAMPQASDSPPTLMPRCCRLSDYRISDGVAAAFSSCRRNCLRLFLMFANSAAGACAQSLHGYVPRHLLL